MSRRHLIALVAVAASVLVLITGCIIFMEDSRTPSISSMQQTILHVEQAFQGTDVHDVGSLTAALGRVQSVRGVSRAEILGRSIRYYLESGLPGYCVGGAQSEIPDSTHVDPNAPMFGRTSAKTSALPHALGAARSSANPGCPPWHSRQVLIADGVPDSRGKDLEVLEDLAVALREIGYDVQPPLMGVDFTPDIVKRFQDFGLIILLGHGCNEIFTTGVPWTEENLAKYGIDEEIAKNRNVESEYKYAPTSSDGTFIGFTPAAVSDLPGSLIFLGGCETANQDLPKDDVRDWEPTLRADCGASFYIGYVGGGLPSGNRNSMRKFCRAFFEENQTMESSKRRGNAAIWKPYVWMQVHPEGSDLIHNGWPTAQASAEPSAGTAPLLVRFDASGSADPDGDEMLFEWAFGEDDQSAAGSTASHTYHVEGTYSAVLTVTDTCNHRSQHAMDIIVTSDSPAPDECDPDTKRPVLRLDGCPNATSAAANFRWLATDNCSGVDEILYRYRLDTDQWWPNGWGSATSVSFSDLPRGSHFFEVQARDAAGNESEIVRCTFAGDSACPPPEGVTEFTGTIYRLGPPPIAWISDRSHVSGVDITGCYLGPQDVEVYCDSIPCEGFVSPNLQVGDEVEVRGYFRDGGNGSWAEIHLDDPSYYLRKTSPDRECPPPPGVTRFTGVLVGSDYLYSAQERHEVSIVSHISGPDLGACYASIPVLLQWGDWYDPPDEGWVDDAITPYSLVEVYGLFVPDPELGNVVHLRTPEHYLKPTGNP